MDRLLEASPWIGLFGVPLATALLIAFAPARVVSERAIALGGTLLTLVLASLIAALVFDWSDGANPDGMAFSVEWLSQLGISLALGVDSVSMLLILLSALLGPLCVLGSWTAIDHDRKTFYAWLLVLQAAMTGVFAARDLVVFYTCFEFTLVPMYVLISLFGSSNRKAAATKFFLYTFTGSLVTLAGFVYVVWYTAQQLGGEWTFDIATLTMSAATMSVTQQTWVMLAMLAGFAVKVPLFPVHTWLPMAHTEAPTAGSVVLAGVLLKLGTYGIYRFVLPFCPAACAEYAPIIATLSIIGIVYAGLICWVQTDVKKLVAYSSVSHLGFCVLGLFALNSTGIEGSVLYMINHGLSTGGLFFLIGFMYERYHTRSMRELGGLGAKMPVWTCFMVFFAMASVGLPGLNGFVSEFMCMLGTFQAGGDMWQNYATSAGPLPAATWGTLGPFYALIAGTGVIVAAIYLLFLVGRVCFGPLKEPAGHAAHEHDEHGESLPADIGKREIATLLPLAIGCLVLGLKPGLVLDPIEAPVIATVEAVIEGADRAGLGPGADSVLTAEADAEVSDADEGGTLNGGDL
ncbi:MAG: NADH-quinone oxidoreductase subunit M [Planctomycetota bacterium]